MSNNTERLLTKICEKTFLKLWVYPNVYKKEADELCDLLVVFENNIFIFSVKSIKFNYEKKEDIAWKRWKNKAIDESMQQIQRAESWIIKNPEKIFLDAKCEKKLPITIDVQNLKIHRILVAHGAMEACKNHSEDNIAGSLAISYSNLKLECPFHLFLGKEKVYHILDSYNLEIILGELDTISDLTWYFEAKEEAIKRHNRISYCGEEDLLVYYLSNFDYQENKYFIDFKKDGVSSISIEEGFWEDFKKTENYRIKKEADKISYKWDEDIQYNSELILDQNLSLLTREIMCEMAKEPRHARRELSEALRNWEKDIWKKQEYILYSLCGSFHEGKYYLFFMYDSKSEQDYDYNEYISHRRELFDIYCGVVKNQKPEVKKIIGMIRDAPISFDKKNLYECTIFNCLDWSEEKYKYYDDLNKELGLNFGLDPK